MAKKLPSGNYRSRITYTDDSGKRKYISFTRPTEAEADYAALEYKLKHKRESSPLSGTVGSAVQRYIDTNDAVFSPSTVMGYRKILRCYMTDIENVPLRQLSNERIQKWVNRLARKYAPKTVSNAYGLLTAMLGTYMPEANFHAQLPQRSAEEFTIPQPEDIQRLLEAAEGTSMYLPILLGAHCGLRRSEMCALTWKDIDLKARKIRVKEALVRGEDGWERKGPKSVSGHRTLDMTDAIYEYLCAADKNSKPVTICPDTITKRFRLICDELGMPFHQHLLRHYFGSVCASLNIPITYAVKLMGHKSDLMLKKVYAHVLNQKETEARSSIVGYFNG